MLTEQELRNTYILNDRSQLFELYMEALTKVGAKMCATIENGGTCRTSNVIYYDKLSESPDYVVKLGGDFESITKNLKQLTIADLIEKPAKVQPQGKTYEVIAKLGANAFDSVANSALVIWPKNGNLKFVNEFEDYSPSEIACNIHQFNALCNKMSLNFKKGAEEENRYSSYLRCFKRLLTKENSDYSFYKKQGKAVEAPTDACAKGPIKEQGYKLFVDKFRGMVKSGNLEALNELSYMANQLSEKGGCGSFDISKPEPIKPLYTQAMKDAGELPSAGMRVLINDSHKIWRDAEAFLKEGSTVMCTFTNIKYKDVDMVSVSLDSGLSCCFRADMCKPIDQRTPEQKQVDITVNEVMSWSNLKYDDALIIVNNLQSRGFLKSI